MDANLALKVIKPLHEVIAGHPFPNEPKLRAYYGLPMTESMLIQAERTLGVKLPTSYVEFLKVINGGFLWGDCFHFGDIELAFSCLHGIGYEQGIDAELGSGYMIEEWGYPSPAVWIGGDGHTAVMLDYRVPPQNGEVPVIWVDTEDDGQSIQIAASFGEFIRVINQQTG